MGCPGVGVEGEPAMKLSDEVLDEGRTHIRARNLDGLKAWVEKHAYSISAEEVAKTYKLLFMAKDTTRALKLFDKVFTDLDPVLDVLGARIKTAVSCVSVCLIGLGCVGGIAYLIVMVMR
jgi:hypothetical protein